MKIIPKDVDEYIDYLVVSVDTKSDKRYIHQTILYGVTNKGNSIHRDDIKNFPIAVGAFSKKPEAVYGAINGVKQWAAGGLDYTQYKDEIKDVF